MAVSKYRWQYRADQVQAVRWNGDNHAEIEEFFARNRSFCEEGQGPYFPEDDEDRDSPYFYNTLQFYVYDDHEVDENTWLIFTKDHNGDPLVLTMNDDQFHDTFERPTD